MSIMCIYKKQSGCFSWDCIQATHIQKHISIWMFQLGLHIGNLSVHEHNMHKTLWMPTPFMRQTPYAWLMEIIWLQTLNHKSCSSNVIYRMEETTIIYGKSKTGVWLHLQVWALTNWPNKNWLQAQTQNQIQVKKP